MTAALDSHPIENLITSEKGMPDVEGIGFWAELKYKGQWPVRHATPLRLGHYTSEQKSWLLRRATRGEQTWLVLQVRKEWFFFDAWAAQQVGNLCHQELIDCATHYFPIKPSPEEVCRILTLP